MHCVDLGESFPTSIYYLLANLASIQPRTSPVKFVCSPRTDRPGSYYVVVESSNSMEEDDIPYGQQRLLRCIDLFALVSVMTIRSGLWFARHALNSEWPYTSSEFAQ